MQIFDMRACVHTADQLKLQDRRCELTYTPKLDQPPMGGCVDKGTGAHGAPQLASHAAPVPPFERCHGRPAIEEDCTQLIVRAQLLVWTNQEVLPASTNTSRC